MKLYDYPRSSAAYRVRIALNLKNVDYERATIDLRRGSHRTLDYLARNPQGLVPMLEAEDVRLTQSLAIIECLEEVYPDPPLLPEEPADRAQVRALTLAVACDIHPLGSLRVLQHLEQRLGLSERERTSWCRHWVMDGFTGLEARLKETAGTYAFGDTVSMADVALVPQVHHARRYGCDLARFPTIRRVEAACLQLDAFEAARPERQVDAA